MKKWMCHICILLVAALFLLPSPVSAHAKVQQSIPAANAKLDSSPTAIKIEYSEGFNADVSQITLEDETGRTIEGKLGKEGERWLVYQIPELAAGVYTVKYKVLSSDTHVTEGTFNFSVVMPAATPGTTASPAQGSATDATGTAAGSPAATAPATAAGSAPAAGSAAATAVPPSPAVPAASPQTTEQQPADQIGVESAGLNQPGLFQTVDTLLRILDVLAAIAAAGFLIFRYGIWGGLKKEAPPLFSLRNERTLYIAAFVILLGSGALQSGLLAARLSGPGTESFPVMWLNLLTDTAAGAASWLRPAAAALLLLAASGAGGSSLPALLVKSSAMLLIIVLFPLTGHAAGDSFGMMYPAVVSQVLHIGAAAVWAGGLTGILAAIRNRKPYGMDALQLNRLILRFSVIALPSLFIIAGSGIVLALLRLGSWSALFRSTYGQLILAKSSIALLILGIAAFHRLVLIPQMNKGLMANEAGSMREIPKKFILGVRVEIALAVAAFVLAGMLSGTAPPDKSPAAPPVYWHVMGDTAHMSMRISFREDAGQTLRLDAWLPTGGGAPTRAEVRLVRNGDEKSAVIIPLEFLEGGSDPYGFEGFDKYTYKAEGRYFSERGEWKATVTFTDSTGDTHTYDKEIIL